MSAEQQPAVMGSGGGDGGIVEFHTLNPIPPGDRYGNARSLFGLWFVPSIALTIIVVGVLIGNLRMSLAWSISSVLVGCVFGTAFMAYHSAQGPALGVPQMVQSRAQFGMRGNILPMLAALAVELGYYAVLTVLCGQLFAIILPISEVFGIVLGSAIMLVITLFGYKLVHRYSRVVTWLTIIVFVFLAAMVFNEGVSPDQNDTVNSWGLFSIGVGIAVSVVMVWAPFVADYSRYLPVTTRIAPTFWYTYLGCCIGSILALGLGILISRQSPLGATDPVMYINEVSGTTLAPIVLLILILGLVHANVLDLYSGSMVVVTIIQSIFPTWLRINSVQKLRHVRWVAATVSAVLLTGVAIIARGDFLEAMQNYILLVLYFLVPWTGINLVDFYLIRRGKYEIPELYCESGRYGNVNIPVLSIYLIALAAQVPFINTTIYQGPLVSIFNGADLAWIVGLIIASIAYYGYGRLYVQHVKSDIAV